MKPRGYYGPLILGSYEEYKVGDIHRGIVNYENGGTITDLPTMIIRRATVEEFIACHKERYGAVGPTTKRKLTGAFFWEVSTD